MAEDSRISGALDRFEGALRRLEAAMAQAGERETTLAGARGEAEALRQDRARLAEELDQVRAKASELDEVNRQAQRRVDLAMSRIRKVLGK
jgi:FtsZ-binding cell division protein ZapB